MADFLVVNRAYWDEAVDLHFRTAFYDVTAFKNGKCTLSPLDAALLGDVGGRSLLHLHCHFGLDTLSWGRRGATVTGVDLSPRAVELARSLAKEVGIAARFCCGDVTRLGEFLPERFDIVWAVEGVLAWIPDLRCWMTAAAEALRPGGVFYLRDFHPVAEVMTSDAPSLRLHRSYFSSVCRVNRADETGTYADRGGSLQQAYHYEWQHSLGDVVTAVLEAGLVITAFQEFPFCTYRSHAFLVQGEEGRWVFPSGIPNLPLMFSLQAYRPNPRTDSKEADHG